MRQFAEATVMKYATLLDFCGRALMRPFRRALWWTHRQLDRLLMERPGFWGNLWRLFHRPDWQRSSKFNARIWVTGFMLFYPLARQHGHPLLVNLSVTTSLDLVVYLFHKRKVWAERTVGYRRSYITWYFFTMATFFVNLGGGWLLFDEVQLGRVQSKSVLEVVGVLINPWVFRYRDRVAIRDRQPKIDTA